ncbi:MAG TPA: glycine betaine ABC transporter substrate-binding protein [Burkholderiales bacterium]
MAKATLRRLFLTSLFAAAAATPALAQEKVVLGRISLSFYAVTGEVVQAVLERLGHKVEVKEGTHDVIFPLLAKGEVDLLNAAWLPNAHRVYWERHQQDLAELGTLYEGAQLFWAVPAYVPPDAVRSAADLAKPEVSAKVDKTIRSIGAGAGITINSKKAVTEYGLDAAGYGVVAGTPKEWVDNFAAAHAAQRWLVMPLWRPQYLNKAYALRMLADPKGALGPADRAVLLGNKAARDRLPKRTLEVLARIRIPVDDVTAMDYVVNVEKKSPADAAKAWMGANAAMVDGWFR